MSNDGSKSIQHMFHRIASTSENGKQYMAGLKTCANLRNTPAVSECPKSETQYVGMSL